MTVTPFASVAARIGYTCYSPDETRETAAASRRLKHRC